VFRRIDADDSGSIDSQELARAMADFGVGEKGIERLLLLLDSNFDGEISADEFREGFALYKEAVAGGGGNARAAKREVSTSELDQIRGQDISLSAAPSLVGGCSPNAARYQSAKGDMDDLGAELDRIERSSELAMAEEGTIRAAFDAADTDRSKTIDREEFCGVLDTLGIKLRADEFAALIKGHFAKLDKDGSEALDCPPRPRGCPSTHSFSQIDFLSRICTF
jgi:Ca2+-binding EF-hand superfamily protein